VSQSRTLVSQVALLAGLNLTAASCGTLRSVNLSTVLAVAGAEAFCPAAVRDECGEPACGVVDLAVHVGTRAEAVAAMAAAEPAEAKLSSSTGNGGDGGSGSGGGGADDGVGADDGSSETSGGCVTGEDSAVWFSMVVDGDYLKQAAVLAAVAQAVDVAVLERYIRLQELSSSIPGNNTDDNDNGNSGSGSGGGFGVSGLSLDASPWLVGGSLPFVLESVQMSVSVSVVVPVAAIAGVSGLGDVLGLLAGYDSGNTDAAGAATTATTTTTLDPASSNLGDAADGDDGGAGIDVAVVAGAVSGVVAGIVATLVVVVMLRRRRNLVVSPTGDAGPRKIRVRSHAAMGQVRVCGRACGRHACA
jgi:hypothetical protein